MRKLLTFPNPVNETSARLVAGGVVAQGVAFLAVRQWWVLVPLAYGFLARVLTGPRLSPLGQFVTRVVTPRLDVDHRFVPGPPKRFAQGMGLTFSGGALVAWGLGVHPVVVRADRRPRRCGHARVGLRRVPRMHRLQQVDAVGADPRRGLRGMQRPQPAPRPGQFVNFGVSAPTRRCSTTPIHTPVA